MNHSGVFQPIGRNVAATIVAVAVMGFSSGAIADNGEAHQADQARPITLGVSGSSIEFLEVGGSSYCYAGTRSIRARLAQAPGAVRLGQM